MSADLEKVDGRGGKRAGAGRKRYEPTSKERGLVTGYVACLLPIPEIARRLNLTTKRVKRCFAYEIEHGASIANSTVISTIYNRATGGGDWKKADISAALHWDKTRNGNSDVVRNEHSGPNQGPIVNVTKIERVIFDAPAKEG